MNRVAVSLVALGALLTPGTAYADGPTFKPIPPGEDRIEVVPQGQPAPFTGQLFDNKTALRWANYIEQCRARLVLDLEAQQKISGIQIDALKEKSVLEQNRYNEATTMYQTRIRELEEPPFYRSVWFGVTIGVVATIATVSATAWVLHETR